MRLQDTTRRKDSLIPGIHARPAIDASNTHLRDGAAGPESCGQALACHESLLPHPQSPSKHSIAICETWDWSASYSGIYQLQELWTRPELVLLTARQGDPESLSRLSLVPEHRHRCFGTHALHRAWRCASAISDERVLT